MSDGARKSGWPPRREIAASEETRVRVERLVKRRGMVLVDRVFWRCGGREPDLMLDL